MSGSEIPSDLLYACGLIFPSKDLLYSDDHYCTMSDFETIVLRHEIVLRYGMEYTID